MPSKLREVLQALQATALAAAAACRRTLQRDYAGSLGGTWQRYLGLELHGKIMAGAGACLALLMIIFIASDALRLSLRSRSFVEVTGAKVNVRSKPSARGKILLQVRRGAKLGKTGESGGWLRVRGDDLEESGWISRDVARFKTARTFILSYDVKGYGLGLLAALLLWSAGFRLRRS